MNKHKKKKAPKPLLYIDQPDYDNYDQQSDDYVISPIEESEKNNNHRKMEKAQQRTADNEAKPAKKVDQVKSKRSNKKSFKEMSIEEKVDFIINLPQQLPRLTAEIETEEAKVRGLIYEKSENIIKVRTYQAPYKAEINLEDIIAITIVSL
ncbi:hypothetical protein CIB95_01560 [Lottiidibacillus patelloidae]|uniref:Spore coat protein CotO n=1 Tax=Lottiidibacillus patelloidae TaxID=2670334 RepID=A0A263BX51_9BACI|nr:CotO family spore coat protein [Lottiidibacillus patelloidae]OZM58284.1 hypothetical protein CIB95_01560 [Lottiidibacillus patelloidae]